jgi:hypothetical protein
MSQRDHLVAAERMSKIHPPELDLPTSPPEHLKWIWMVFQELNAGRQYIDPVYPQRISNQEVLAWCSLTGEKLSRCELAILRILDGEWINTRLELAKDLVHG